MSGKRGLKRHITNEGVNLDQTAIYKEAQPEVKLLWAILEDAVKTVQRGRDSDILSDVIEARESYRWLFADYPPYSIPKPIKNGDGKVIGFLAPPIRFRRLCHYVNLDHNNFRQRLRLHKKVPTYTELENRMKYLMSLESYEKTIHVGKEELAKRVLSP